MSTQIRPLTAYTTPAINKVVEALRQHPKGITARQLATYTEQKHQNVYVILDKLHQRGWAYPANTVASQSHGRHPAVWKLTPAAEEQGGTP